MQVFSTIRDTRAAIRAARLAGRRIGLVPTMGALHEGHLSLVRSAKAQCDLVAVSIFVNPTQFAPNEDFAKYPRAFERDRELLAGESVALLFAPSVEEMYPPGALTHVIVEQLSDRLCGKSRAGHFQGVATVVTQLFHILEPDLAFFGQKDAAQLAIVRHMVRDLNIPVEIFGCPIVREPDGLAMSSRNTYLNRRERKSATALYRSLVYVEDLYAKGERSAPRLAHHARTMLAEEPGLRLDYFEVVDTGTLDAVETASSGSLVAVAAFVGSTRLIDNIILP